MAAASKARQFHTQQVHFLRTLMNYNDPDIAGRKIGTIGAGANILRTNTVASTAVNFSVTATLSVGFNAAAATDLVNATSVIAATANIATQAPVGKTLLAADTDIYVTLAGTGAAPTTGVVEVIVEYVPAI